MIEIILLKVQLGDPSIDLKFKHSTRLISDVLNSSVLQKMLSFLLFVTAGIFNFLTLEKII